MPAANRYTTTELLASIRRKGHIPTSQNGFADTDLLALSDDETLLGIMSQILSVRENYYSVYTDYPTNNASNYPVPLRAIGGALGLIKIVNGTQILEVGRSELSEQYSTVSSPTGYYSFTPIGNTFQIQPNPGSGVIRTWFYTRPNQLVPVASAAQITAIAGTTLTFATGTIPTTWNTSMPMDIVYDQPGFDAWQVDVLPSSITPTTITFPTVPSTVNVGDWVALAGQTPVPQIPVEYRPVLVQRVVVRYYEIQGYLDKMKAAEATLKRLETEAMAIINPRVAEEPKRIIPNSDIIGGYRRWRSWRAT